MVLVDMFVVNLGDPALHFVPSLALDCKQISVMIRSNVQK